MRFLIDENMPRPTASWLTHAGYPAVDVRDIGLDGRPDSEVIARAMADGAVLITGDQGFKNLAKYPLGSHAGVIVLWVPSETRAAERLNLLMRALDELQNVDLTGCLVIIEPKLTRMRRPEPE